MKYALNIAENGRILSACKVLSNGNYDGMPIVGILPEGDITDYLYAGGEFVLDPISELSAFPVAPCNITAGAYITVDGVLYKAISNIPCGEYIITGQNAIETTVEEQLAELAKGE